MLRRRRPDPIAGETVVITGAGSGIGSALARRLSRAGSPIAIVDVDGAGLQETQVGLSGPVLSRVLDVRDAQAMHAFAQDVHVWAPRRIGAVFNNAGVATASTVLDSKLADDEWLHEINFHGVQNGVRAFLPILVAQDHGAIVNTSSVFGLFGMPYNSAYCASKFAVRGFTEALRHEVRGTGVRAITIHPGGIRTNIVRNGRMHGDPQGLGRSKDELAAEFATMARTTPEQAARVIHRGVDAGRARILIGADAHIFDTLVRIAPTRYYDVIAALTPLATGRRPGNTLPTTATPQRAR